ncbi:hypothetical protein DOS67_10090, partial [Staphylococcus felis]|uniref:lipase-like domain-containing protein n=1 Tax=Staphylococcus felis TaxID=46127 RepID=UPI000E36ACBC
VQPQKSQAPTTESQNTESDNISTQMPQDMATKNTESSSENIDAAVEATPVEENEATEDETATEGNEATEEETATEDNETTEEDTTTENNKMAEEVKKEDKEAKAEPKTGEKSLLHDEKPTVPKGNQGHPKPKKYPTILVHGFAGFPDEKKPFFFPSYWGGNKVDLDKELKKQG